MGLRAKWIMTCDGCGLVVERARKPEDGEYIEENGVRTYYSDMWGYGIPDGWLQIVRDEFTNRDYLFFHDGDCYGKWLDSQGRIEERIEFESAIWIA